MQPPDDLRFQRWATEACAKLATLAGARDVVMATCRSSGDDLGVIGSSGGDPDDLTRGAAARMLVRTALRRGGYVELAAGLHLAVATPAGDRSLILIGRRAQRSAPLDPGAVRALEAALSVAGLAICERDGAVTRLKGQRVDLVRAIHDDVVQRLFGATLALQRTGPMEDELRALCAGEVERALSDLRAILRNAIDCAPVAATATLASMVRDLASQDVHVDADLEGIKLAGSQESVVCSVLAEAVRNARKHASPTEIRVSLESDGPMIRLEVTNDGTPRAASPSRGVGLRLAATEAAQVGGVLEHGTADQGLWMVRLTLPKGETYEDVSGRAA